MDFIKARLNCRQKDRDIDLLRGQQEPVGVWLQRRHFLNVFWKKYPTPDLNCLSYCYINTLQYGCAYSYKKMEKINLMVREMILNLYLIQNEKQLAETIQRRWSEKLQEIADRDVYRVGSIGTQSDMSAHSSLRNYSVTENRHLPVGSLTSKGMVWKGMEDPQQLGKLQARGKEE